MADQIGKATPGNLFSVKGYSLPSGPTFGPSLTIAVLSGDWMQFASIATNPDGWSRTFGQYSSASNSHKYSFTPQFKAEGLTP